MPTLRPLRDYDEHEVLPFYTWSGNLPVNKGTIVKLVGSGLTNQNLQLAGAIGSTYPGVVSERWTVVPQVATVSATGDKPIGMLLFDGRTVDENGENLLFRPRKAAEMQAFTSGQAVPVVTRGLFQYSGVSGTVVAGADAYFNYNDGSLTTEGRPEQKVGRFLGAKDTNGYAYVKIDIA
jgi:hypothetical protein